MNRYKTGLLLLMALFANDIFAQSNEHRTEPLITDGSISYVDYSNGYTMLSGYFTQIGPYTGSGVSLDPVTGIYDASMPKFSGGSVLTSISDGNGGWFVGGYFEYVGDTKMPNLAHITSDKKLDTSFNPNPDYGVQALALSGNILYTGGWFQNIGGQPRNHLAAIDLSTNTVTSWNPNTDGNVYTMAVNGSGATATIYVGGYFTKMGGVTRNNLAAVSATGGLASWNPSVTGIGAQVNCMTIGTVSGKPALYVAGYFTQINGVARNSFGVLDISTGAVNLLGIVPTAALKNGTGAPSIQTMALSKGVLYLGGNVQITGYSGQNLIALDATKASPVGPFPTLDGGVYSIAVADTIIYAGGYFSTVNGNSRPALAAISLKYGLLKDAFDPRPLNNESVATVSFDGSRLFAGGYFSGVNFEYRNGFALIEDATDKLWPFTFDLNGGQVYTMEIAGSTMYIGGYFSAINKNVRRNLAAIDLGTGSILPSWTPSPIYTTASNRPPSVNTMKIKDNLLYIGGVFNAINTAATPRLNLAAIDLSSGTPSSLNISVGVNSSDAVNSLDISGNSLYVAGAFSSVAAQSRGNLAGIDLSAGSILPWAPDSKGEVRKIKVANNTAYVVGDFLNGINGESRQTALAAIDLSTGKNKPWNPNLKDGAATDVEVTATDVYVGGYYDSVGMLPRMGLSSYSLATGLINSWNPDVGGNSDGTPSVEVIAASPTRLHVGGSFEYVGIEDRTNYTEYDLCPLPFDVTVTGSTLEAPAATSYQWYKNGTPIPGASDQSLRISYLENGTFAVEVVIGACTVRSKDFTYLVTGTHNEPSLVKYFPNPAHDELFIEVPQRGTLILYDMMGRNVRRADLYSAEINRIDLRELNSGTYVAIVQVGDVTNHIKILKTH